MVDRADLQCSSGEHSTRLAQQLARAPGSGWCSRVAVGPISTDVGTLEGRGHVARARVVADQKRARRSTALSGAEARVSPGETPPPARASRGHALRERALARRAEHHRRARRRRPARRRPRRTTRRATASRVRTRRPARARRAARPLRAGASRARALASASSRAVTKSSRCVPLRRATDRLDETEHMRSRGTIRRPPARRRDRDGRAARAGRCAVADDPAHARAAHQQRRRERVRQADTEIEAARRAAPARLAQQRADPAPVRVERQHLVEPRRTRDQAAASSRARAARCAPRGRRAQRAEARRRHHDVARPVRARERESPAAATSTRALGSGALYHLPGVTDRQQLAAQRSIDGSTAGPAACRCAVAQPRRQGLQRDSAPARVRDGVPGYGSFSIGSVGPEDLHHGCSDQRRDVHRSGVTADVEPAALEQSAASSPSDARRRRERRGAARRRDDLLGERALARHGPEQHDRRDTGGVAQTPRDRGIARRAPALVRRAGAGARMDRHRPAPSPTASAMRARDAGSTRHGFGEALAPFATNSTSPRLRSKRRDPARRDPRARVGEQPGALAREGPGVADAARRSADERQQPALQDRVEVEHQVEAPPRAARRRNRTARAPLAKARPRRSARFDLPRGKHQHLVDPGLAFDADRDGGLDEPREVGARRTRRAAPRRRASVRTTSPTAPSRISENAIRGGRSRQRVRARRDGDGEPRAGGWAAGRIRRHAVAPHPRRATCCGRSLIYARRRAFSPDAILVTQNLLRRLDDLGRWGRSHRLPDAIRWRCVSWAWWRPTPCPVGFLFGVLRRRGAALRRLRSDGDALVRPRPRRDLRTRGRDRRWRWRCSPALLMIRRGARGAEGPARAAGQRRVARRDLRRPVASAPVGRAACSTPVARRRRREPAEADLHRRSQQPEAPVPDLCAVGPLPLRPRAAAHPSRNGERRHPPGVRRSLRAPAHRLRGLRLHARRQRADRRHAPAQAERDGSAASSPT